MRLVPTTTDHTLISDLLALILSGLCPLPQPRTRTEATHLELTTPTLRREIRSKERVWISLWKVCAAFSFIPR
jgi:hypothetical protein